MVALVVLAGVVACMHLGKVAIVTPALQHEFSRGAGAIGWLGATFASIGALVGVPAGAAVAAAGDRRMLVAGLASIAVGSVLGALAGPWIVLPLSRLVEGLGFVLVSVAGPAILQRLVAAPDRNLALAMWSCYVPAGIALVLLAGPWFDDWRTLWWLSGAAAAGIAGMGLACIPSATVPRSAVSRRLGAEVLHVLRSGGPLAVASCFLLYSLMFYALFAFLPVLLLERLQTGPAVVGPLSALACAANVVGNLAAGGLIARLGRPRLVAVSAAIMGACAAGIFFATEQPLLTYLLCVLFSMAGGLIPSTLLSSVPVLTPSASLAPIGVGLAMQGSNLGQTLGPLLLGSLIERQGWPAAGALVMAASVLLLAVVPKLRAGLTRPSHVRCWT